MPGSSHREARERLLRMAAEIEKGTLLAERSMPPVDPPRLAVEAIASARDDAAFLRELAEAEGARATQHAAPVEAMQLPPGWTWRQDGGDGPVAVLVESPTDHFAHQQGQGWCAVCAGDRVGWFHSPRAAAETIDAIRATRENPT